MKRLNEDTNKDAFDKYYWLLDTLGSSTLCDAIASAIGTDQLDKCCNYILREYDLKREYEEEQADADDEPGLLHTVYGMDFYD